MSGNDALQAAYRGWERRSDYWTRSDPHEVESGLTAFRDLMTFDAAIADGSRRRVGRSDTAALVFAALALVLGAAAWISDSDQITAFTSAALSRSPDRISFDDRFSPLSLPDSPAGNLALRLLDRSAQAAVELKFRYATGMLARQLMSRDWRTAFVDQIRPVLMRARPMRASSRPGPAFPCHHFSAPAHWTAGLLKCSGNSLQIVKPGLLA